MNFGELEDRRNRWAILLMYLVFEFFVIKACFPMHF